MEGIIYSNLTNDERERSIKIYSKIRINCIT